MTTINAIGTQIPVEAGKGGTGLDTVTAHCLTLGDGTNPLNIMAIATDGQIPIGKTDNDPVFGTPGSTDSTIAWTLGANTLTAQARAGTEAVTGVVQYATAAQTTTATSEALAVHPAGLETRLGAQTDHGVMIAGGGAGFNLAATAEGATGTLLTGVTGDAPVFTTATYPATTSQGDILLSSAANVISALAKNTDATRYLSNTGADNNAAWAQINVANGVTGTLPVANAGTGQTTYTDGQILIGNTTGNTLAKATLTAGAGIGITNGNGTITIAATASGMGFEAVTDTTKQAVVDTVYTCDNVALVTVTLPDTAAVGSTVGIIGKGAGLWKIAQNASEEIHAGTTTTTNGVGGSLAATEQYDIVYLVCTVADTEWTAIQMVGNLTAV